MWNETGKRLPVGDVWALAGTVWNTCNNCNRYVKNYLWLILHVGRARTIAGTEQRVDVNDVDTGALTSNSGCDKEEEEEEKEEEEEGRWLRCFH